ncbi:MAG: hypothetical protein DRN08_02175 [Thermoplasmata archaeon]|nr:MAG: hypothetical protein DRN05_03080 [Thermoplasmata archaeon]RLF35982.1 MAG: hypothetical protein DRN08_02175 [Thermoplasmata archaeon]
MGENNQRAGQYIIEGAGDYDIIVTTPQSLAVQMANLLTGIVAEKVIRHTKCSVIAVRSCYIYPPISYHELDDI